MTGNDYWNYASHSVARIRTSTDGLTWTRADVGGDAKNTYISALVTGGPVLVALGESWKAADDPAVQPAIWTSVGGLVWEPADASAMGSAATGWDIGIIAGGSGFVAYGRAAPSERTPTTWGRGVGPVAIWTSRDGRTWKRVGDPGFGPSAEIICVAAAGSALIAYGQEGGVIGGEYSQAWKSYWVYAPHWGHAAVWTSSDGLRWRKAEGFHALDSGKTPASDPKLPGDTTVFSVTRVGGRWVALGVRTVSQAETESAGLTSGRSGRLLLWTSADAERWTPYLGDPLVDGYALSPPVASQGRLLVVGRDEGLGRACAWSARPPASP